MASAYAYVVRMFQEVVKMYVIDKMLEYMEKRKKEILISADSQLSEYELGVIIVNILWWLKAEYKRSIKIAEGGDTDHMPLMIDTKYPWCANLKMVTETEELFRDHFTIADGKFDFLDTVSEEDRAAAREKAYYNYDPPM